MKLWDIPLEDKMENLLQLDEQGMFPGPEETSASVFFERIRNTGKRYDELQKDANGGQDLDKAAGFKIGRGIPIPPEDLSGAKDLTSQMFDFSIDWVPAYYLSEGLGILWGGCTVSAPDNDVSMFFIRKNFSKKEKWFIYSRKELLAHEICHVARAPLHSTEFEEHFAYMTSSSPLRRFLGNCFRRELDALIFIGPMFLLLIAQFLTSFGIWQIPSLPFWIIALGGPVWLILRNIYSRSVYSRARRVLARAGITKPAPVLFRMTDEEIHETAKSSPDECLKILHEKAQEQLRWRMIESKFFPEKQ